jgi:hypothetical protein
MSRALASLFAVLSLCCSRSDRVPQRGIDAPVSAADRAPERTPAPPHGQPPREPVGRLPGQAPQVSAPPLSSQLSRPAPSRLVAIGDLHGDLDATRRALRLAGAIDASDQWSGGTLVVVQTGDCIDRGNEDRGVLDLLGRLREQAAKAGGELILLNGNHELMNVQQDFRYVTQTSMAQFSDLGGRSAAFEPGSVYARIFATQGLFVRVGDSVFVHGGILAKHVAYGLNRMDDEVRAWERGERPDFPPVVADGDGVVWTREYSIDPTSQASCDQLRLVLHQLSARRMVVGHTVQPKGMNSACDGMVWRIDVGMSKFYGGPMQVLELTAEGPRVLEEPAAPPSAQQPESGTTAGE